MQNDSKESDNCTGRGDQRVILLMPEIAVQFMTFTPVSDKNVLCDLFFAACIVLSHSLYYIICNMQCNDMIYFSMEYLH